MTKEEIISQIRAGKLAIENDGTVDQLNRVLRLCWPADLLNSKGRSKFYIERQNGWQGDESTHLDVIKVTELIQLMEERPPQHTVMGQGFHIKKKMSTEKFDEVLGDSLKAHGLIEPQPVPQLLPSENEEEDYEPFGPEWEKTLMKLPKKFIIDLYRKKCTEPLPLAQSDPDKKPQES